MQPRELGEVACVEIHLPGETQILTDEVLSAVEHMVHGPLHIGVRIHFKDGTAMEVVGATVVTKFKEPSRLLKPTGKIGQT